MAQRVVWLVATGKVRPEEVLGLTFTTKAAAELRHRVTAALGAAGLLDRSVVVEGEDVLEPTVATYHAYAASLLTDHGLRIGHEPDTRVVSDASRYQLGARVIERFTGHIELLTDHPPTAIQNLLALDGAMSEHLVDAGRRTPRRRRGAPRLRAGASRRSRPARAARPTSSRPPRRSTRSTAAPSCSSWSPATAALKADLGLMDFADQIALAARLVDDQPEVGRAGAGALQGRAARRVPGHLGRAGHHAVPAVLRPDPEHGLGHPVMAVGDPNQAIYGWRGASVSNILHFADTFPAADGEPGRLPLTVNRRSDRRILEVANRLAEPLLAAVRRQGRPARAPPTTPGEGARRDPRPRARGRRAGLAGRRGPAGPRRRHRRGPTSACSPATTPTPRRSSTPSPSAGIPVEIVGLSGLIRLPEVAEVVATLHLLHDVTANAVAAHPAHRPALGDRPARPAPARPCARPSSPACAAAGRPRSVADQLLQIADGIDPAELARPQRRASSRPATAAYSPEALERFALLAAELRRLRAHVGEPLLDVVRRIIDTTGVDVELASADLAGRGRAARQPRPVRQGRRGVPVRRRRRDAAGAAGLPHRRGRPGQRPRRRHPDRRRLGQAAHRPPRQGPGVGVGVPASACARPGSRATGRARCGPPRRPCCRRRCAATRADLPQLAGHDKAALDAYRAGDPRPRRGGGAAAGLRRLHPRRPPPQRDVVPLEPARDALRPVGLPGAWSATSSRSGASRVEHWLEKPAQGRPNPYDDVDPSRPWPVPGPGEEARRRLAAAELVRERRPDRARRGPRHGRGRTGRRLGRRARPAARRGPRRPRPGRSTCRCPTACRRPRWRGCATTPRRSPASWPGRCRGQPSPAARFGTRFHAWVEAGSASRTSSTPTSCPAAPTPASTTTPTSRELVKRVRGRARSATARRTPSRRRSRSSSTARWCAAASTRSTPSRRRRLPRRRLEDQPPATTPTRSSWPSTGWPGPSSPASPLDQVRAAFYYVRSGRDRSSPTTCPAATELEADAQHR